jgi:hypothetical protein
MRDPILIPTAIGILIAGGERFSSDGLRNISQPLILQPTRNRIWSLPVPPEQFLYQSVVSRIDGTVDLIGGYRFSRNTGIQLNSNTDRIVLPQLAICD